MKVETAIELLKNHDPEEQIIIAWWRHDLFHEVVNDREDFESKCEWVEDQMDWSDAHDQISELLDDFPLPR